MKKILRLPAMLAMVLFATVTSSQAAGPKDKPAAKPNDKSTENKVAALAVDSDNGYYYGWAYDQPTRQNAEQLAIAEAKKHGARSPEIVLVWSGSGCGAYRTTEGKDNTAYGWGVAETRQAADQIARTEASKRSNGRPVPNHVWACNSTKKPLSIDLMTEPLTAKLDICYVQFEANIERSDKWVGRFYTPVYELRGEKCPEVHTKIKNVYSAYFWTSPDNETRSGQENSKLDPTGKGERYVRDFQKWLAATNSPYSGTTYRKSVSMAVIHKDPKMLEELVGNNRRVDAGMTFPGAVPTCIDYKPDPEAVVQATDACKIWVRQR